MLKMFICAYVNYSKTCLKLSPKKDKKIGFQSKKEGKYQERIQSSTTPDPGYQWESDHFTIRHRKREPRGQSFPSR